ncbi:MAG: hypothetical protein KAR83_02780 [Thermodesulfovibrionales bacterium]|nr:hypothetical protein [Thermodesulfovibrionales bacterium]
MRRVIVACALILSLCVAASAEDCLQVTEGCTPVVSFELHDVELRGFLESVALEYGINMVISSEVGGQVSANLRHVDLFDAIDSIISSRGYLRREIKGGLMVVEPAGESELRERDLLVKEFRLRYVDVMDSGIMNTVSGVLSRRGKVMSVEGSNSLVVKDVAMGIDRAEALLASLDMEPRQVIVEARMVEISKGSASELGINWGASHSKTSGDVFGGLGTVEESFGVNLPDVQGDTASPGGVFGFSVISDRVSLDLRIQALETAREARTVSSPRVQVAENTEAVIADGTEILVPSADTQMVVSGGEGTVEGVDDELKTFRAVLGLSVTPRVVAPGRVALKIEVMREWFDYEKDVEGFPPKLTKTVSTNLIINDGETIAIGGIETGMDAQSEARVPLLSRIPFLGALFRSRAKEAEMRELVIFLTPFIVGEESNVAGTDQTKIIP